MAIDTDSVLSGRILLTFSDYLGDRNIIVNLAAVETISDFDLIYLDQRKRRQWGARLFDNRVVHLPVRLRGPAATTGSRSSAKPASSTSTSSRSASTGASS